MAFSATNGPAPTQVEYAFSTPTTWSNEALGIPAPIGPYAEMVDELEV